MQLHVLECYFFCVLVWEDQGLLQYSPCVVRVSERSQARLLSHSCSEHLSSHWSWPPWPAADPSPLSLICSVECLLLGFFNQNQPTQILFFFFFLSLTSLWICDFEPPQSPIKLMLFCLRLSDVQSEFEWLHSLALASWRAFLCSFETTSRRFWGIAFLCLIGNRCREEHFPPFQLNLLECLKTVRYGLEGSCFARGGWNRLHEKVNVGPVAVTVCFSPHTSRWTSGYEHWRTVASPTYEVAIQCEAAAMCS